MQPEGLAGLTNGATPSREAIYISKRRGFIRIAIQASARLRCMHFLAIMVIALSPCACLLCGHPAF